MRLILKVTERNRWIKVRVLKREWSSFWNQWFMSDRSNLCLISCLLASARMVLLISLDSCKTLTLSLVQAITTYYGYGCVSGLLLERGLHSTTEAPNIGGDGTIDPITGLKKDTNAPDPWKSMTEEQKEAEAEKLFILFDRMNQNGIIRAVPPNNL